MTTGEGKKRNEVYIYRVTGHVTICADNSMGGTTILTPLINPHSSLPASVWQHLIYILFLMLHQLFSNTWTSCILILCQAMYVNSKRTRVMTSLFRMT